MNWFLINFNADIHLSRSSVLSARWIWTVLSSVWTSNPNSGYCDDFVILSRSYSEFNNLIPQIQNFLGSRLKLRLHENKVLIRRPRQGIDFLGYVILPNCIVLRTKMRKRMIKKVNVDNLASYSGILKHCKGYELEKKIVVLADLSEKVPK